MAAVSLESRTLAFTLVFPVRVRFFSHTSGPLWLANSRPRRQEGGEGEWYIINLYKLD